MRCHACGAQVRQGQKFCMECGASLRGVADDTGEVPVVTTTDAAPTRGAPLPPPRLVGENDDTTVIPATARRDRDDEPEDALATAPMASVAHSRPGDDARHVATTEVPVRPEERTGELLTPYRPDPTASDTARSPTDASPAADRALEPDRREPRRFRLRPLLALTVLAAAATVTAVLSNVITIETDIQALGLEIGDWKVNDFGTNNAVAALVAAAVMVLGGLVWCMGARWGAGLAGGAGAGLAGWVALMIGLAELQVALSRAELQQAAGAGAALTTTRDVGYWALAAAGGLGVLVLLLSLLRSGRDGHAGLDPWIAALGAASFLLAAGGPLIPQGSAEFSANYTSTDVDLPTAFFAGRLVQLGLLAVCGVAGFLLVRRWGLGLAVGGAGAAGWMLVTAATNRTDSPIGPGFWNFGARSLDPHAVTIVGFALVGFFALVAIVMALLDSER